MHNLFLENKMDKNLDEIFDLYLQHGKSDYIGEQISQIEHALQAANLAEKEGFEQNVVLAAFLHDIGHLLREKLNKTQMINEGIKYGVEDHEKLGAEYLRKLCVPEKICFLVENHVLAKRYLAYKVSETYILIIAEPLRLSF
jgi:2-amino-1-hydroxyethylphosphonate dioxygenase (glycine-forming)